MFDMVLGVFIFLTPEGTVDIMIRRKIHPGKTAKRPSKNLSKKGKKKQTKVSRAWIAWKFLKGIIFICCLTIFLYQSVEFLRVYYKYPTTTKIEFTYPAEFELPAVTFCGGNM